MQTKSDLRYVTLTSEKLCAFKNECWWQYYVNCTKNYTNKKTEIK